MDGLMKYALKSDHEKLNLWLGNTPDKPNIPVNVGKFFHFSNFAQFE
jgi:hypothetical protein